ncbi:MAG: photosynthetic protein synthase I [Planctomycetes bacterium]|nr:photosynthetic protein synthase I [Planctomycetota bacterium]
MPSFLKSACIGKSSAGVILAVGIALAGGPGALMGDPGAGTRPLAPLPKAAGRSDPGQVALGRLLFRDGRLSGDGSISCATCHDPARGFADGLPLSKGYPGALYFRNTPTVLNAAHGRALYWDGRLPSSDLPTLVRDHLSEAHFMQADGRLLIERLKQMPVYVRAFREAFGGEPTYGRILDSVAAYLQTLQSRDVPFDLYLQGEEDAITPAARRGLEVFRGKAGCVACHDGPMLSDGELHNLGLPRSPQIFDSPERSVTFRRFLKTLGVERYDTLREDIGAEAVTKLDSDRGCFRTPTLREVSRTAPYMHDGSIATLEAVVEFYDRGGGDGVGKDAGLRPLGLTPPEKEDLVEFLRTLSGAVFETEPVELPAYEILPLGER